MSNTVFNQRVQLVYPENNDAIAYVYGMVAARTVNQSLYFRVGDMNDVGLWQADVAVPVKLAILYYDTGSEAISVTYSDDGTTETTATVVTKGSTGLWKWATVNFDLQGAHLIYQNFNSADFYLSCTGEMAVAAVVLIATDYDAEVNWFAQPLLAHLLLHEPYIADLTNAVHTHANAAGGGQLDWDNVWTDAVHSHASAAEGGQLDWDNVWTDAVHTHASAAEGDKLAQANTHESPDTDAATTSLHHTIGAGANQAAAGNHTHTTTAKTVIGGHGEITTTAAGATDYLAPFGSYYGTLGRAQQRMPMAGTAKNLAIRITTAQPGSGSLVFTLYKNGAATALKVTIAAGSGGATWYSDTTNTVSFAANDDMALEVVNNAAAASAAIAGWTLEYDT